MQKFQSTSSVRRTTIRPMGGANSARDFNPRPPCGGRHHHASAMSFNNISIHVLRAEDDSIKTPLSLFHVISIHVLRAEDDFVEM